MYTSQKMFDAEQSRFENMLPEDNARMFADFYSTELTDKEIEHKYGPQYTIVEDEERWI